MPRATVFGPRLLGGLGMLELFVEQGRSKGMKLLEHVQHENSLVGVQIDHSRMVTADGRSKIFNTGRTRETDTTLRGHLV